MRKIKEGTDPKKDFLTSFYDVDYSFKHYLKTLREHLKYIGNHVSKSLYSSNKK